MESLYGGAMETMASTFSGLTSTLEDTMAELDNARGEGYNTERAEGLQAEIDAYGGQLGQAVEALNTIAGQNEAYMENLSEQYTREALSAVLLGQQTSGIFDADQQKALEEMRDQFPPGQRGLRKRQPGGGAQDGESPAGGRGPGHGGL